MIRNRFKFLLYLSLLFITSCISAPRDTSNTCLMFTDNYFWHKFVKINMISFIICQRSTWCRSLRSESDWRRSRTVIRVIHKHFGKIISMLSGEECQVSFNLFFSAVGYSITKIFSTAMLTSFLTVLVMLFILSCRSRSCWRCHLADLFSWYV